MDFIVTCTTVLLLLCAMQDVEGHGRLTAPPGRSTAHRYGFNTPKNYNDNQLNCGGFSNQWDNNNGKCGLCGDPYQGPRDNEAGGTYATGVIVDNYEAGSEIDITVEITANHKGWNEFRLCKNDNVKKAITQECLDEHLLVEVGTGATRILLPSGTKKFTWTMQLPTDLTCTQCVLQWKWNAGNSYGVDADTGEGCVGCGPQEQFYGCADIAISGGSTGAPPPQSQSDSNTEVPPNTSVTYTEQGGDTTTDIATTTIAEQGGDTTTDTATTTTTGIATTARPSPTTATGDGANCYPVKPYDTQSGMDEWCVTNCAAGYCPSSHCKCGPSNGGQQNEITAWVCRAADGPWKLVPGLATWCNQNCNHKPRYCPASHCTCTRGPAA